MQWSILVSWFKKLVFSIFLIAIIGVAGWTWFALKYVYSTGERAGYVQKFSQKGWVFKTWEGELALVNLPGAMPEIFNFTVRNKQAVEKVRATMGNRVIIKYNEHKFIPTRLFGDTSYFVVDARPVEAATPPPPLPVTK